MTAGHSRVSRQASIVAVVVCGIAASFLAAWLCYTEETRRITMQLEFRADWREKDMESKLHALALPTTALVSWLASEHSLEPAAQQKKFSEIALIRSAYISLHPRNFIYWPVIRAKDRAAYEERMGAALGDPKFKIVDKRPDDTLATAGEKPFYLPLTLRKIFSGTPRPLGYDITSDDARFPFFDRAGKEGLVMGARPLPGWKEKQLIIQFIAPIYTTGIIPASEDARMANLQGFVTVSYDLQKTLDFLVADTPRIIEDIYFVSDDGRSSFARFDPKTASFTVVSGMIPDQLPGLAFTRDFNFYNVSWKTLFHFPPAEVRALRSYAPALFLVIGLIITAVLAVVVKYLTYRREQMKLELMAGHTQLRATENELSAATIRLTTLVECSPAAIICLDNNGKVTLWNPAATRIFGYKTHELLGKPCPLPFPIAASNNGKPQGGDGSFTAKNGQVIDVSYAAAPFYGENEAIDGTIFIASDVTDKRSLETQLYHSQKMEAMGQLTGGVAHDFNNLLGVAIGNLDLMEGMTTPEGEPLRVAALGAMIRGSDLVKALLAFSRRQPLQPKRVNVNDNLKHVVGMLRRTIGEEIEIRFTEGDALWPALIDITQLESAVTNLCINARDAMPKGGRLLINTNNVTLDDDYVSQNPESISGNYVCVEVTDTGTGMTPEVIEKAFEPFFTTKEKGKGTGLGLSQVYGFIKQSGGHVKIYSEVGLGTTIRLYLPRADANTDAASETILDALPLPGQGETILVVEDNHELRDMAVMQLKSLGYHVLEAANGNDALTIMNTTTGIDLLFSDVVMPGGLSGFDVARKAHAKYPKLSVLLTSGFPGNMAGDEGQELEPGFSVELLGKPYRKNELARKIRETLSRRAS
jgi:PAS domain S-box-containing protein